MTFHEAEEPGDGNGHAAAAGNPGRKKPGENMGLIPGQSFIPALATNITPAANPVLSRDASGDVTDQQHALINGETPALLRQNTKNYRYAVE